MMKKILVAGKVISAAVLVAAMCAAFPAQAFAIEAESLVPMGNTVGIQMKTDGVMIVGVAEVANGDGAFKPADEAGLKAGDKLVSINSHKISSANDFLTAAAEFDGSAVNVVVNRDGKEVKFTVTPVKNSDGTYQLGLWLRDGMSGIGTVTFFDPATGVYGALGHGINDLDSGELMSITDGVISEAGNEGLEHGAGAICFT